jgi:hypothetical protein
VLATLGDISFQYEPGNHADLARQLNALARRPERLRAFRAEAFRLGQARFNWEFEQRRLVDVVEALPSASPVAQVLRPARPGGDAGGAPILGAARKQD